MANENLTRRDTFVLAVLQGLLVSYNRDPKNYEERRSETDIINQAITIADEALAALS